MTTHAYSQLYLGKECRAVGNMLHDAVVEFGINRTDLLKRFIQSDVAEQLENGNPKYIAGKKRNGAVFRGHGKDYRQNICSAFFLK